MKNLSDEEFWDFEEFRQLGDEYKKHIAKLHAKLPWNGQAREVDGDEIEISWESRYKIDFKKLKLIPSVQASQEVSFVFIQEPVTVRREIYDSCVPDNQKDFLDLVSHCKITFYRIKKV
jgi:hypothetical protein